MAPDVQGLVVHLANRPKDRGDVVIADAVAVEYELVVDLFVDRCLLRAAYERLKRSIFVWSRRSGR